MMIPLDAILPVTIRTLSFSEAIDLLVSCGHSIEPTNIPGLVVVDGRELTMGQIKSLALDLSAKNTRMNF